MQYVPCRVLTDWVQGAAEIEVANQLYCQDQLNKASDTVNNLADIADSRMSEAATVKENALEADEAQFLQNELKNAKATASEKATKHDKLRS